MTMTKNNNKTETKTEGKRDSFVKTDDNLIYLIKSYLKQPLAFFHTNVSIPIVKGVAHLEPAHCSAVLLTSC